jgi:hypothetical protein
MDTFTLVHVVLSLIGIVTGLVVLYGLLTANRMDGWTLVFLFTTVATSITGFLFPYKGVTPAIILGILSLVVLAAAIAACYAFHLAGSWRWIYVVGSVVALYFTFFVLVVQAFLKIPALRALAPQRFRAALRHRSGHRAGVLHPDGNSIRETVLPCRRLKNGGVLLGISFRHSFR